MPAGEISKRITPLVVVVLVVQFLLITGFFGYRAWKNTSDGCVKCHSDRERLKKLGAEWAFVTPQQVRQQSRHPYITCRDCHLGDGRAETAEKAHRGMLKMLIVAEDGSLLSRKDGYPGALRPSGDDEMFALMPKTEIDGELVMLPWVRNILWHDRDPVTLGFDPKIAEKTCGKKGCHPEALKQFNRTIMGRNYRQRTMRTWLVPYGPHNCGPSFADLPPIEVLTAAGFDYTNTAKIQKELNTPFSTSQAEIKQKFCNVCHAGCLDCHYRPFSEEGRHAFTSQPDAKTCSGGGRGASTCHPGAMVSRRGETYIGGDYSIPQGMPADVHYDKGIQCIDCHPTGDRGMGDIQREAYCQDCHIVEEDALQEGFHRDMLCTACHINQLGGYQITIWGPGKVGGQENPFHKYSLYYGVQKPPIIIKDQKGKWMPVKIWPHSVGNIKVDVPRSDGLKFRWPDGQTRDAYYIVGTFDDLPDNNKHLLWLEIQEAAHSFSKARDCESCHASETQIAYSEWEFYDIDGAEPFSGQYRIIADKNGIRITDMKNTTPIIPLQGRKLSDFASWVYMPDRWTMPGDFSISIDRNKYLKYKEIFQKVKVELDRYRGSSVSPDKETQRAIRAYRLRVVHNLKAAEHERLELPGVSNK